MSDLLAVGAILAAFILANMVALIWAGYDRAEIDE